MKGNGKRIDLVLLADVSHHEGHKQAKKQSVQARKAGLQRQHHRTRECECAVNSIPALCLACH